MTALRRTGAGLLFLGGSGGRLWGCCLSDRSCREGSWNPGGPVGSTRTLRPAGPCARLQSSI